MAYDDNDDLYDDETRMTRRRATRRGGSGSAGLSRDQRFIMTLSASAALMLVVGVALGFALGRATAATPRPPAGIITAPATATDTAQAGVSPVVTTETPAPETTGTLSAEPTESAEATPADTQAPDTPDQLAPDDGDHIDASHTTIRWSKVSDDSGVTYAFEIQDHLSDGTYGRAQVIGDLKTTSYRVRVLGVRRRWRVWAVDGAGNKSDKSAWNYFVHTRIVAIPSTDTSGTAN